MDGQGSLSGTLVSQLKEILGDRVSVAAPVRAHRAGRGARRLCDVVGVDGAPDPTRGVGHRAGCDRDLRSVGASRRTEPAGDRCATRIARPRR